MKSEWQEIQTVKAAKSSTCNLKKDKSLVIESKIKKGIDETHHRS